jgi:hypothetical protein
MTAHSVGMPGGLSDGLTECFTSNKEVGALFLRATLIAAAIAAAAIGLASPANAETECPPGYYPASSGDCVPRPQPGTSPCPNPTAICRDGDYSCSEHPYSGGTCHGHGGVQTHLT